MILGQSSDYLISRAITGQRGRNIFRKKQWRTPCRGLVDFKNASGGQDNVTVVGSRPDLSKCADRVGSAGLDPPLAYNDLVNDGGNGVVSWL